MKLLLLALVLDRNPVRDASTQRTTCATVIATSTTTGERQVFSGPETPEECQSGATYMGLWESPGIWDVVVSAPGYRTEHVPVTLQGDECHVQPQEMTVFQTPQ